MKMRIKNQLQNIFPSVNPARPACHRAIHQKSHLSMQPVVLITRRYRHAIKKHYRKAGGNKYNKTILTRADVKLLLYNTFFSSTRLNKIKKQIQTRHGKHPS